MGRHERTKIREQALRNFLLSGERYGELPSFSFKRCTDETKAYTRVAVDLEDEFPGISKRLTWYCPTEDGVRHIYVKRLGLNGGSLAE